MAVRTGPQPMPGMMPQMPGIMGAPMGPPPGMPGMPPMPGLPPMQQPMSMPMGGPMGGAAPQGGGRPASLGTLPAPSTAAQRAGFGAAVGAVAGGPVMGAMPADVFAGGIPGGMMDASIPRPVAMMRGGGVAYMQEGGLATPEEQRLGINKDVSGQVIGRSMDPVDDKTLTQQFVSQEAPGWFRSDIYDATVNALEAGKPLENYRIEGRGTQGTLTIVFDDGTRVPTGFRDSRDVVAHANEMVALGQQYKASGLGEPVVTQPEVTQPVVTQPVYTQPSGGGGTTFVSPYDLPASPIVSQPVPVSQPGGGIMAALPGDVMGTSAGPMMGSVYQPTVSSIPTFVSGVSDVFGTRPVTYVTSPQATIRSRLGEIDLPARPESVNVFDWLQTPVAVFGGAR